MMIILAIPLGLLCLLIAFLCYRANGKKQALTFSLIGISSLVFAALMLYWTHLLIEELPPVS